jgi:hypothetical protein
LVRRAQGRVALVAKTPIILMGPRPYDDASPPIYYETEQFTTYLDLIQRSSNGQAPDFLCVASRKSILEDLRTYGRTSLPRRMRESYIEIHSRSADVLPGSRVRLRWHEGGAPMTFLVSDDDFMIWFKDGSGESVWITAHDEVIARALYSHAETIAEARESEEVLRDFDGLS